MENSRDKVIGVWLDQTQAHLIDLSREPVVAETVCYSDCSLPTTSDSLKLGVKSTNKSEGNERDKQFTEAERKNEFFNQLIRRIKDHNSVLLFGAIAIKEELTNKLKTEFQFSGNVVA